MTRIYKYSTYLSMTDTIAIGFALGALAATPWTTTDKYSIAAIAVCAIWLGVSKIRMAHRIAVLDEKVTVMHDLLQNVADAVDPR